MPPTPDPIKGRELADKINNVRESLIRLEAEARKEGFTSTAQDLQYEAEQLFTTVQNLRGNRAVKRGYAEL